MGLDSNLPIEAKDLQTTVTGERKRTKPGQDQSEIPCRSTTIFFKWNYQPNQEQFIYKTRNKTLFTASTNSTIVTMHKVPNHMSHLYKLELHMVLKEGQKLVLWKHFPLMVQRCGERYEHYFPKKIRQPNTSSNHS